MKTIQLNADLRKHLPEVTEETAIIDETGQLIAYLVPPGHREMLYSLLQQSFDQGRPKKLDRKLQRQTIKEIRSSLEQLDLTPKSNA